MKISTWQNLKTSGFDFQNYQKFTGTKDLELNLVRLAYSKKTACHMWIFGVDEEGSKWAVYARNPKIRMYLDNGIFKKITANFVNGVLKNVC